MFGGLFSGAALLFVGEQTGFGHGLVRGGLACVQLGLQARLLRLTLALSRFLQCFLLRHKGAHECFGFLFLFEQLDFYALISLSNECCELLLNNHRQGY